MEKFQSPLKKISGLLSIVFAATSLFIVSCNGKNVKSPTCVKLTKAQIQKWVNKGYLNPQDSGIVRLKAAYAWPGTFYKVYAGVQKADGSLIQESIIALTPVDTCKDHVNLNEFVFSGTLQVSVADWNIWKTNGGKSLNDSLAYIQLDPYTYNYQTLPLLAFQDYVVSKDGSRIQVLHMAKTDGILPCPPCPNCKTPCPPPSTCLAPCDAMMTDTTDN